MFCNLSSDEVYPKTVHIRNSVDGCVWQVYHVNNINEAKMLGRNSLKKGFERTDLVDYSPCEETFPNWRESCDDEMKEVLTD